jgi:hypothetical protein
MNRLITFRADEPLLAALKKASRREYISVSDLIRRSVVLTLRNAGLLDER